MDRRRLLMSQDENLFDMNWFLECDGWVLNEDGYYQGLYSRLRAKYGAAPGGFPFRCKPNTRYQFIYTAYSLTSGGNGRFRFYDFDSGENVGTYTYINNTTPITHSRTVSVGSSTNVGMYFAYGSSKTLCIKDVIIKEID